MVNSLRVWRVCRAEYAESAFSGDGAFRFGGRWSPPGLALVYCAESRSLAAMEVLVHRMGTKVFRSATWVQVAADVPTALIEIPLRVPPDWRGQSPVASAQRFGAEWANKERTAALRVPSAVVLGEFNYLLNPKHADFPKVAVAKPEPFIFDARLGV